MFRVAWYRLNRAAVQPVTMPAVDGK